MNVLFTVLVTFFAGMGAGLGTGFAGMSAAAVISPMLITFLHMDPYMAVGIALSSDVLASAVSAYTYHKNKNLDIKNGLIMMASVLCLYGGGQLGGQQGALRHHGRLLGVHDLPAGRQVHSAPGDDHQGSYAGCQRPKACGPVGGVRCAHRLHLRLYRRRRRHDDAAHPHQCAGLRAENCRGHQRVHYDLHRPDRCCLPLHDRRCARLVRLGAVRGVHPAVGAHCRRVCQQGRPQDPEPCHRRCAGGAGRGHYGLQA